MQSTTASGGRDRELAPDNAHIDLGRESARLRQQDAWTQHGQSAITLFKYADLRGVLIALKQGARMREHQAEGRLSLQCLSGRLVVHIDGRKQELTPQQVLVMERCVPHEVEALQESEFLITLAWAGHIDSSA
jgi:quercetin dioxygenase-like cupin family protein